ncbi:MAG: flagellar hook-basal body complex protein [Rhodobacteraceae bacterium]|nr:flagellar hook-basal body complex protein [Paracoccaceae bacterium]
MENTGYTTLTRQTGLANEMRIIANNIANMATTGYRQEGLMFSEYVAGLDQGQSVSMAAARIGLTSMVQGTLTQTGGALDLAIEGDGFFLVETPNGPRATRSGAFSQNANGELVNAQGFRVLDPGEAPIFVPPNGTGFHIAADGTLSAEGRALGQIGVFDVPDRSSLRREDGVMFASDVPFEVVLDASLNQGFLESSNVDPVGQIARMIEVQRAYEMGQSFLETESERARTALQTLFK